MQINDAVWVKVSRDKERGGVIKELGNAKHYVQIDDERGDWYDHTLIRKNNVAVKHDNAKNRLELIPVSGIEGIGRAMTFGASKYSAHNWANGFGWSRLVGSCLRHLFAWSRGEDKDPESGLSHLDHAGACIVMLIAHESEKLGTDDRRKQC